MSFAKWTNWGRACSPQRAVSRNFVFGHKIADGYGEPSLPKKLHFA